jgi:hypothetical protein
MKRQASTMILGVAVLILGGCIYTQTSGEPPPPLQSETIVVAPGPGLVWISGEWAWRDRWVWVGGYWGRPPHPHAVWVPGCWTKHGQHFRRVQGHWR